MTTEFKLPALGENIESGDVVSVLVSVGDTINKDDPILELETDKATVEVPSSVSGTIEEILVKEGDTISVGQVILRTNGDGSAKESAPAPAKQAEPAPEPKAEASPEPEPEPAEAPDDSASSSTVEFILPDLGENITSGDVVNVLVSAGDTIKKDDPVLELETDKATLEVPSSVAGTIETVHVSSGETVNVGQVILTVTSSSPAPAAKPQPKAETPAPTAAPEPEPESEPEAEEVSTEPTIREFILPDLGENIEAGDVINVLVSAGDTIKKDDPVLELETDKATLEVPSSIGGTIKGVHVKSGDMVRVGQLVLTIESTGAAPKKAPAAPPAAKAKPEPAQPAQKTQAKAPTPAAAAEVSEASPVEISGDATQVPAAPNVRRIARELGVDVTEVKGTGPGGRLSIDDVKLHAKKLLTSGSFKAAPAAAAAPQARAVSFPDFSQWGEVDIQPMKGIRKATANQMGLAWSTIPHVTNHDKADIGELEQLRKRFSAKVEAAGGKLTVTAILLKVVAAALKQFPQFNASVDMANQQLIYKKYYNIGVAVDTDRGLLVPVIRNVDQKNIQELAVALGEMSAKARDGKLGLDEMQGGTFTITNLGGIGGTSFTPIVNHPEVAILGISRGAREPIFNKETGEFEPHMMLPLSLSYDHRLIDGADAARFLRWIINTLEEPFMMALQGW
ncbi:MAG: 2-oxo acid dehydrogenase subunit E2 [Anaerolineales bacterium]|nr:2-oxo acid dehydrogenase subunit E2 [Anaerolineales bacterium]